MYFKISWDQEFDDIMMHLWSKYGKGLFTLDGIGEQLDLNKFSKNFFNNPNSTADVSVDANANVVAKTGIEYNFEMPKPLKRYNSYFLLWKELRRAYGLEYANNVIERQLTGDIYINDFTEIASPYCFNYSTLDISLTGLVGISQRLHIAPPKSLATFFRQCEQFLAVAANSTLGATGMADLLIVASTYVSKIIETGKDGHIVIADVETYVREQLTSLIYTLNWAFRSAQSPFTNVSLYDDTFLDSLCPDYNADKEVVKMLQRIYVNVMNAEMRRTPLTFPVTTACFAIDDNREIGDKAFLQFIAEVNREFGFINLYNGSTATLSSCCFSGDTKVLWKSSTTGVRLSTFKELHEIPWESKKNFRVFHNGSWVIAKSVRLPGRQMYKVTTANHKEYLMTDNHINVTLSGEKETSNLSVDDYLLFNTRAANVVPENDEGLTYAQGYAVGAFLGNGSFGTRFADGIIRETGYSMNICNYEKCVKYVSEAAKSLGGQFSATCSTPYNNVYPVRISSMELVAFIQKWTDWKEGTLAPTKKLNLNCLVQSYDFRKGILDGWYDTDGGNSNRCYTTSEELKECMEALITSLGMNTVIDVNDRTNEPVLIRGQEFTRNYPLWCVRWYAPKNKRSMGDVYITRNNSIYFNTAVRLTFRLITSPISCYHRNFLFYPAFGPVNLQYFWNQPDLIGSAEKSGQLKGPVCSNIFAKPGEDKLSEPYKAGSLLHSHSCQ